VVSHKISATNLVAHSSLLIAHSSLLSSQQPHRPAGNQDATQEHGEAIQAVADHVAGSFAVGNTEDDRRKQGEYRRCAEMIESNRHFLGLPMECI